MRPMMYKILALVVSALMISACGSRGGDLQRRPEFKIKKLDEIGVEEAKARWLWSDKKLKVGRQFVSRIDANNRIWRADSKGGIHCSELKSGAFCGKFDLDIELSAGIAVDSDVIAVVSRSNQLITVDKSDGVIIRRAPIGKKIRNPPVAQDGIIIVRPDVSRVEAYDAYLGTLLWEYETSSSSLSIDAPLESLIYNDEVFSGLSQGQLVSQDLVNGSLTWKARLAPLSTAGRYKIASDIVAPPVISASQLYVAVINEGITAYGLGSRQVIFAAKIPVLGAPVVDTDLLYVKTDSGHVIGLDSLTGQVQWQQGDLRNRTLSNMVIAGGHLWIADNDGTLFLIDRDNGSVDYAVKIFNDNIRLQNRGNLVLVEGEGGELGALSIDNVAEIK